MEQLKYREHLNQKFKSYKGNSLIYEKFISKGNVTTIIYNSRKVCVEYINQNIVSIFIAGICDEKSNTNSTVLKSEDITLTIHNIEDEIVISGDKIITCINKIDSRVMFKDISGKILCEDFEPSFKAEDGCVYISKIDDCYAYYGFGEKGGDLNKKGYYIENFNTDDPETDDESLVYYKTIPFYVALNDQKTYGIFFDNSFRSFFDMGKSYEDRIFFGAIGGHIQYNFILGKNIKKVICEYANLTGKMDMPPLWSLGYQQNRFSYMNSKEILNVVNTFKDKEIPIDVIYFDIDYMDGFRVMTFKVPEFEDAKPLIKTLKDKGIRTITILDPGVKVDENYNIYKNGIEGDHFVKNPDGTVYIGAVWPNDSSFPDFSNKQSREWWKSELKKFISDYNIDGIWNDMNEPCVFNNDFKTIPENCIHNSDYGVLEHKEFHNRYGFEMSRCSYEAQEELNPNLRSFSMSRAIYSGGQRYTSVWTGDNMSLWSQLRMSISMNCNLGISGFSFVGNDVGGFSLDCDEELFIRWMQVGTFLPIFRNHSNKYTRRQEPWSFGFRAEKIARNAIELRYRLIPYIYTCFYESHKYGLPMFRPLVMEYQNDINVINMKEEFMIGNSILIAPVLHKSEIYKTVYLPKGKWYDFMTNKIYNGGQRYRLKCDLNTVIIFIREGSIIPTYEEKYLNTKNRPNTVTFNVYGNVAEGTYYYDDGITNEYRNGKYNLKVIKVNMKEVIEHFLNRGLDYEEQSKYVFI